jgi:hypothetical protein
MRRHKRHQQNEDFAMSLMDLLTTALGCILLIFIVYSLLMNGDLQRFIHKNKDLIVAIQDKEKETRALLSVIEQLKIKSSEQEVLLAKKDITVAENKAKIGVLLSRFDHILKELGDSVDPRTAQAVDMMLVIDATSSMQNSLSIVKQNLETVIAALHILSHKARVGITVFRDRREKEGYRLQQQSLTADIKELKSFLRKITAGSTAVDDDRPEWLCGGIQAGILGLASNGAPNPFTHQSQKLDIEQGQWRAKAIKIMIVVSDAGAQDQGAKSCIKLARAFEKQEGKIHVVSTIPRGYTKGGVVNEEYNYIVLKEHAAIARAGLGEHIQKAKESRLLESVLGSAYKARMNYVNQFIQSLQDNKLQWQKTDSKSP